MKKIILAFLFVMSGFAHSQPVTLYGLTLGEKIDLPECPDSIQAQTVLFIHTVNNIDFTCIKRRNYLDHIGSIQTERIFILYPEKSTDSFWFSNVIEAHIDKDNRLIRFTVLIKNYTSSSLFSVLSAKFGNTRHYTISNSKDHPDMPPGTINGAVWYFDNRDSITLSGYSKQGYGVLNATSGYAIPKSN